MYTVIVVDDEASVRERIVSFLKKEERSFKLLGEYENGYDALMYGVPQSPDLIITDVKMPFVNGLELIEQAQEELPVVQSIIISGFDSFDYAKKGHRSWGRRLSKQADRLRRNGFLPQQG